MNLKNLKPVGGFYRYGFSLYVHSQHTLDTLDWIASQFAHNVHKGGLEWVGERVLVIAETHCGGHNLLLEEIVIQDGLIVFCDINRSWQVAFATDFERYMKWLRQDGGLTAHQYEKELQRKPYEPRIENED